MAAEEYILGINQEELERLRFQHGVWKDVTDDFFDRIGIKKTGTASMSEQVPDSFRWICASASENLVR